MNHPLKALLLSGILLVSLPTISGQNAAAQAGETEGVFVLGVDGMDPTILTQMMAAGDLPNLATLAKEGAFQTLETTTRSHKAWALGMHTIHPAHPHLMGHDTGHRNYLDRNEGIICIEESNLMLYSAQHT